MGRWPARWRATSVTRGLDGTTSKGWVAWVERRSPQLDSERERRVHFLLDIVLALKFCQIRLAWYSRSLQVQRISLGGTLMRKFLKLLQAHFVADVPPDIHACEMCAQAPTCTAEYARTCDLRLEAALAERRWEEEERTTIPSELLPVVDFGFGAEQDEGMPRSDIRAVDDSLPNEEERCA